MDPLNTLNALRVTRQRWDLTIGLTPTRAAITVVGSWLLLAWGRLGIQGVAAPRTMLRFVLVGVYAWLLVIAVTWGLAWLARRALGPDRLAAPDGGRLLEVTGSSHQPLVVMAVLVQFGQLIPLPVVLTVAAGLALGLWMPAMLTAAVSSVLQTSLLRAAAIALVAYLGWLATAGRYLADRVGHLI